MKSFYAIALVVWFIAVILLFVYDDPTDREIVVTDQIESVQSDGTTIVITTIGEDGTWYVQYYNRKGKFKSMTKVKQLPLP